MRVRVYVDGKPEWTENVPSRARIPWSVRGSFSGSPAVPEPPPKRSHDRSQAAYAGWEKRRTGKA